MIKVIWPVGIIKKGAFLISILLWLVIKIHIMVQVQPPRDSGLSVIFLDVWPVYALDYAVEFSF